MKSENIVLAMLMIALLGLSIWLQFGLLETEPLREEPEITHDPDYYVENFTATGMDEEGIRYVLEAERMVHYPDDGSALLDNPHVIQFQPGSVPRHVYAESGWLSGDGGEVRLTGNVRVIQGMGSIDAGGVTTANKMKIQLKGRKS